MPIVEFSAMELKRMREASGLRQQDVAICAGVSRMMISEYETGHYKPSAKKWRRILRALYPYYRKPGTREYEFEIGKRYQIEDVLKEIPSDDKYRPQNGIGCVFEYAGKAGIHHSFLEVIGGWTRTYTDAQLLGKRIKEVHE